MNTKSTGLLDQIFTPAIVYQYKLYYTASPEGMMKVLTFEWLWELNGISDIKKLPSYFEDTAYLELGNFLKYDARILEGQHVAHMPTVKWEYALDHWGCE